MRSLPALLLAFVAAFTGRLSAQGNSDPITLVGTIPSQSVSPAAGTPPIDLRPFFAVPTIGITNPVVQFTVPGAGVFNVEMKADVAPLTVANFLDYVSANWFTDTLIHRSNPTFRIIQGGGYTPNTSGTTFASYNTVVKNAALNMEAANTMVHARGTIAMARTSASLNTATSEWFINTADNTSEWSPASALNANSYAAFGRVTGTGMNVVDAIAALPRLGGNVTVISSSTANNSVSVDLAGIPANFGVGWTLLGSTVTSFFGTAVSLSANANATITSSTSVVSQLYGDPFTELPILHNLASSGGPVPLTELVKATSLAVVPVFPTAPGTASVVTFSAVSSNPSLVRPTISGSNLYLGAALNLTASATVTVTATDSNGNSVSQTAFNVSVTRKVRDYNSDGNGDLIFQNGVGNIAAWSVNPSGSVLSNTLLSNAALGDWKLVATADLNGDSIPDFVFQNNAGQVVVWYLNASGARVGPTTFISTANLGDWRIVATADINKDGNADLIFQNNAGQIAIWYMNGSGAVTSSVFFSTAILGDWRIKCTADINGDGFADLVFQNNAGQIAAWYLGPNGSIISKPFISTGALGDWKIALASDIDGDGIADLIFQNNIGQLAVWHLNASGATTSSGFLSTSALGDWRLH